MASNRGRHSKDWKQARREVIARDTYCTIPGCPWPFEPVSKVLTGRHEKGPTIDHINGYRTRAEMLDRANLRLAHRQCNTRKGARSDAEMVADGDAPSPHRKSKRYREW